MIRALLTIDDVSSQNTPAIVDYLCEKEIPAILFMIGKKAENLKNQGFVSVWKNFHEQKRNARARVQKIRNFYA